MRLSVRETCYTFPSSIILSEGSILSGWVRRPFATGVSKYADRKGNLPASGPLIYLEVKPGWFKGTVFAIVDTAAPWCIFEPTVGDFVRESFDQVSDEVRLSTRIGTFGGALYRGPLFVPALEGEPLDVEATVFVSSDWPPGMNFLGYEGLLQRIRFAVDPEVNLFYFGRI